MRNKKATTIEIVTIANENKLFNEMPNPMKDNKEAEYDGCLTHL